MSALQPSAAGGAPGEDKTAVTGAGFAVDLQEAAADAQIPRSRSLSELRPPAREPQGGHDLRVNRRDPTLLENFGTAAREHRAAAPAGDARIAEPRGEPRGALPRDQGRRGAQEAARDSAEVERGGWDPATEGEFEERRLSGRFFAEQACPHLFVHLQTL